MYVNSEIEKAKLVLETKNPTFLPRLKDDLQENYHNLEQRYPTFDTFKVISGPQDIDNSKLRCNTDDGFCYYRVQEVIVCFKSCVRLGLSDVKELYPWAVHSFLFPSCSHVIRNEDKLIRPNFDYDVTETFTEI